MSLSGHVCALAWWFCAATLVVHHCYVRLASVTFSPESVPHYLSCPVVFNHCVFINPTRAVLCLKFGARGRKCLQGAAKPAGLL